MANELDPKKLFEEAANSAALKNQKALDDPFKKGSTVISAKQLNADKFLTYDSKTYGKLGFDPFKDNDKLYNSKTHWSEDIGRAWDGMWKLAGVGFQDTFGFGLMAEKDNWKNFDEVMQNYSSTREGYTKFWSNTMLSSGYTIGIIGAIAAEEMALALTTGGLGNLGTAGLVGTQLGKAFNKLENLTQGSKVLDKVSELGKIDDAVKWYSGAGLKALGGKALKGLNPVGESMNFLSDLNKMDNLTSLQKLATGAGAIARDMRKIYMTHSESNLEAEMARNEYVNKQFEAAFKASGGEPLSDQEVSRISLEGDKVFKSTYNGNLGLIYATNAITFDNMFKSMRYNGKMFDLPKNIFQVSRTAAGKVAVNVDKQAFKTGLKQIAKVPVTYAKKKLNEVTIGNAIKGTLSSSMEGFQELGQDVISNSVKSYYGRNHVGQQVRGGYMDYLYHDVGNAIKEVMPHTNAKGELDTEGVSTFFSGFLMGGFAAPVGEAISITQDQVLGGGVRDKAQYLFQRQKWAENQKTKYKEALAKAKVLSEVLDANLAYISHASNPMFTQSEIQEEMLSAAQNNDKKKFEDAKHESLQQGIQTMLRNNMEGQYADFLDEMATKYSAEHLNQALGRTDITDDNINEHRAKISEKAKEIRNYRKLYDEIEDTMVNPVKQSEIDQLDITDPEQRKQKLALLIKQTAFNNLKSELLFSRGKIINKAKRMEELVQVLNKESELSSTEVKSLVSQAGLKTEMNLLEATVNANKNLNLTGEQAADAKKAEEKLEKLKTYKAALDKLESIQNDENATGAQLEEVYEELFEAYHDYRTVSADYLKGEREELKRVASRKSFDVLFDYLTLNQENDKLQEVVDTLLDPNSAADWMIKNQEMLAKLDKNKEAHIANQLIAYTQKAESSAMLTELQKNNLFFDLNELDDLVDRRIMPSVIYDVETGKPVSDEQLKLAQEIIGSFVQRLTGKSIVGNKAKANEKVSARSKSDNRTTKGLTRQYNIKMDQVIDLSDPKVLKKLIDKLEASAQLTFIEKEILGIVSESTPKIMFTMSGELPVSVNEDGVYVIDIRFAGSDFKNATVSFETLVLTALTQYKATENLKNNAKVRDEVEILMQQAKEAFDAKYKGSDSMPMFSDPAAFLTEALNNSAIQNFLAGVTDTTSPAKKSLWTSLVSKLTMLFKKTFDQTLLQRAVDLAKVTLDESVIDNIAEPAIETDEAVVTEDIGPLDEEVIATEEEIDEALEETSKEAEAEALQNRINEKKALLNAIDAQLAALGKLSFRRRVSLNNKRIAIIDDINRLQEEYDTEYAYDEALLTDDELTDVPLVETEVVFDQNDKLVITDKTPFLALPADLQAILIKFHRQSASIKELESLRNYFRKDINNLELGYLAAHSTINGPVDPKVKDKWDADFANLNENLGRDFTARMVNGKVQIESAVKNGDLTDQEILEIQNAMANDSQYTDLIIEYNRQKEQPDLYVEPVVELDEETIRQMNADAIEKAKGLAQDRIKQQREEARARRRARRASIVPISKMERDSIVELLKKVLKDDFDVLTQADVKKLVGRLMSDSKLSPFKIPDVIAFVNQKKLNSTKKANQQIASMLAEDSGQQLDIFDSIRQNAQSNNIAMMLENVANGSSMRATYKGKPVQLKLSKTELELLLTYHPDLFKAEDKETLYNSLYQQKKIIDTMAKGYRTTPLNSEDLENSIIDLFIKTEKAGMLFPSTVKALNNNFIKAGSKLTIVKSKKGINGVYTLEARDRKLNPQPVTSYQANVNTVRDFIGEQNPGELLVEALIADWFSRSKNNRIHPEFITRNLARGKSEIESRKNLLSTKSTIKTADGLGDIIRQDYSDLFPDDFNWANVVNEVINKYRSVKDMMSGVAYDINLLYKQQSAEFDEYEAQEQAAEAQEQAASLEDWVNFIDSGYGEVLSKANAEYYKSLEYQIENGIANLGSLDYDKLTENQQRLLDKAFEEGLYDAEDAEAANDRANNEEEGLDAFEEALQERKMKETNIDRKINEMLSEMPSYLDSFEILGRLKNLLNDSKNFNNHVLFFAIHNYVNAPTSLLTQKQKDLMNDLLERKLNQGMYVGNTVVLNDMPLQIVGYNKADKTAELVDLNTGEVFTVSYAEFLNAQDVLAEGEEFTKLNVDPVVNDQEIDYIKTTYQDIFNNFTASALEFDKLDAEDINTRLLEELTKCK